MPARFWLWPNLLSLDAPLVALLWQMLFLRCFRAQEQALPAILLVSAVWLIYAADRAIDAWRGAGVQPRHEFYRQHWRGILPVWIGVLAVSCWLAWTRLPRATFELGACLTAIVAAYFAIVHAYPGKWPKEAAVAVIFALGASLTAWTRVETPADVITVVLFSCLCWINCVAIEEWEGGRRAGAAVARSGDSPRAAATGSVVAPVSERGRGQFPVGVLAGCVAVAAIVVLHHDRPILASAEASSALAFVLLDRSRWKFSSDAVRVLADAALLSPIFFLPIAGLRF